MVTLCDDDDVCVYIIWMSVRVLLIMGTNAGGHIYIDIYIYSFFFNNNNNNARVCLRFSYLIEEARKVVRQERSG